MVLPNTLGLAALVGGMAGAVAVATRGLDTIVQLIRKRASVVIHALQVGRQSQRRKPTEKHMSITQVPSETAIEIPRTQSVDMRVGVVAIPVTDVDRAKR
jgi:hypothetical protein